MLGQTEQFKRGVETLNKVKNGGIPLKISIIRERRKSNFLATLVSLINL